jgi:hypothetical protein
MAARLLLAAPLLLGGCAWSLVENGRVREEPFAEVVTRTAWVRGDPRPEHVDARVVRPDEVPALMRASIEAEWTPEEMARYEERLVAIGLWPPERDLLDETLRVAAEEVAGFYLPETRVLYLVEHLDVPFSVRVLSALFGRDFGREEVLSHEIAHLLQHLAAPTLFDVSSWQEQDDAVQAVSAALEGDATHYGLLSVASGEASLLPAPAELAQLFDDALGEDGALAQSPALLRYTLDFPYTRGYPLSLDEGTVLLDAPPASTEQVLHADRRTADFQVADLAALAAALPAGCESLGETTLGELLIWVLLADHGEIAPEEASDGWDGDRYLAARCNGERAFFWWTAWDSEADAEEFGDAYLGIADSVAERAGLAGAPLVGRDGVHVIVRSASLDALLPRLDREARWARITTFDELRAHFHLDEQETGAR